MRRYEIASPLARNDRGLNNYEVLYLLSCHCEERKATKQSHVSWLKTLTRLLRPWLAMTNDASCEGVYSEAVSFVRWLRFARNDR